MALFGISLAFTIRDEGPIKFNNHVQMAESIIMFGLRNVLLL
jgi:hypothetical protein